MICQRIERMKTNEETWARRASAIRFHSPDSLATARGRLFRSEQAWGEGFLFRVIRSSKK
jgi:hypothetical protein